MQQIWVIISLAAWIVEKQILEQGQSEDGKDVYKCIVSLGANELQGFLYLLFSGQIKSLESVLEVISTFSPMYIFNVCLFVFFKCP